MELCFCGVRWGAQSSWCAHLVRWPHGGYACYLWRFVLIMSANDNNSCSWDLALSATLTPASGELCRRAKCAQLRQPLEHGPLLAWAGRTGSGVSKAGHCENTLTLYMRPVRYLSVLAVRADKSSSAGGRGGPESEARNLYIIMTKESARRDFKVSRQEWLRRAASRRARELGELASSASLAGAHSRVGRAHERRRHLGASRLGRLYKSRRVALASHWRRLDAHWRPGISVAALQTRLYSMANWAGAFSIPLFQ